MVNSEIKRPKTVLRFSHGIAISCCLFFMSLPAQSDTLTIYTENFVPYNFIQDEKITGINIELVEEMCNQSQLQCHFEIYPRIRAYQSTLKNANGALVSTVRTSERERDFKWVGPLASSVAYLYRNTIDNHIQLKSLEDSKKYTIASVRGSASETFMLNSGFDYEQNLVGYVSNQAALDILLKRRVDLVLGTDLMISYNLKLRGLSPDILVPALRLPVDLPQELYLALNKNVNDTLIEKLNTSLKQLKASAQFDTIIDRYRQ